MIEKREKIKSIKKKIIKFCIFTVIIALFVGVFVYFCPYIFIKNVDTTALNKAGISECDNLMIVAHPDDESIFGGDHIKNGNYFIMCITNKNNRTRRKEFNQMLAKTGCKGIILSYPDKIFSKRSQWTLWKKSISKDIYTALNTKSWESVVTHNEKGEYGHIHHKMVHKMVFDNFDKSFNEKNTRPLLYVFGKYYSKKKLPDNLSSLSAMSDDSLRQKEELISIYSSQGKARKKLKHIYPYEEWVSVK
ncbi:MAG: PIG-L family deacetylase [Lachnospiraceae bacterium]|nr:PIG-L family deacetylase [Lachnospiraceae bacterium]